MKKKLFLALLMVLLLVFTLGVNRCQITEGSNSQALGYASGKGMGYAVNKVIPKSDLALSDSWKAMMKRNETATVIPGPDMVAFFNDSIITLSGEVNDPYDFVGDLAALLTIYGAEYAENGQLMFLNDVPMPVARYFGMGYRSGRNMALKEREVVHQ